MCPRNDKHNEARKRIEDAHASDCTDADVGMGLAKTFLANYRPSEPEHLEQRAAYDITDTLAKCIPGCLTGDQTQDEDIQALLFNVTAARCGWVKRD